MGWLVFVRRPTVAQVALESSSWTNTINMKATLWDYAFWGAMTVLAFYYASIVEPIKQ